MTVFRRAGGLLLLALVLLPVHRLLDRPETGHFGEASLRTAQGNLELAWWGLVVFLGAGWVLSGLLPSGRVRGFLGRVAEALARARSGSLALAAGAATALLAASAARFLFRGHPTLVDEIASLVHARYLAAGRLSGPPLEALEFWAIPNTLVSLEGWASQYPPFHLVLLAGGWWAGAPWLVGPALTGVLAATTLLVAVRLLPGRPATARLGGLLVAVSPFVLLLGGGYLSHVSAAAFAALALYAFVRARDGAWVWGLAAGAAVGASVTSRPWTGLALGMAFALAALLPPPHGFGARGLRWLAARAAAVTAGGLPFAVGLAYYNARLFGHPLRMGYSVAYGPSHGLGFHTDPWGNAYGPLEALGYTAAGLGALGIHVLETPLPVVVLVGLWLITSGPLSRGERLLLAWAVVPVAANALYWHHGFHLGPRMLYEAAPAWIVLGGLAAVSLAGAKGHSPVEDRAPAAPGTALGPPIGRRRWLRGKAGVRDAFLWALLLAGAAAVSYAVPVRVRSYAWSEETLGRLRAPEPPGDRPALIFVHGAWPERVAATLQATGMSLDSVETALRRNDVCLVHRYAERRRGAASPGRGAPLPILDLEPLPGPAPHLRPAEVAPGYAIWVDPRSPPTPECAREVQADRGGVVSLAPLVWQGDLPALERGRPLFVRDLGPARNRATLARYPHRRAWMLAPVSPGAVPQLRQYGEGVERVWEGGRAPGPPVSERPGSPPARPPRAP